MRCKVTIWGGEYDSSRDATISIIRVLGFLFIITCHIMQGYDCELAWWFNVGVQMFLCLSGYLYGRKIIDNELSFYRKQYIKILVPYYIVIIPVIIVQLLFVKNEISFVRVVKALLCYGTLSGGEHLWFVPTILFCYFLTPLFDRLNNHIFRRSYSLLYCIAVFVILSIVIRLFVPYFNAAWIACFYLGHVLGKNEITQRINSEVYKGLIYSGAACLISIQIVISYVMKFELSGSISALYDIMCDYGHVFLGITVFLLLQGILKGRQIPRIIMTPVSFLDSISYEGYLIHQFFILGEFSLLTIINQPIIAIIAIAIIVFFLGIFVKEISQPLMNRVLRTNINIY